MNSKQIKKRALKELSHYIECALWSSGDDENSNYENFEPTQEMKNLSLIDLTYFIAHYYPFMQNVKEGLIGHNLWLSRNGHGAGFFDSELEHSELLQEKANLMGCVDLYINNTNEIDIG